MTQALREHAAKPDDAPVVLMVVGAGRGPLVRRALRASRTTKRAVRIFAVEKNPDAVITLEAQRDSVKEWRDVRRARARCSRRPCAHAAPHAGSL